MAYELLKEIHAPKDLKKLNMAQKKQLCAEIRAKILETVSKNGGHLASNLGSVELTVALHSVFDSPNDSMIFDVGHQCYAHKLLTGRYDDFDTLRLSGGISGFMKPGESIHDPVITGHSSTSVSVALGIAKANTLNGNNHKSIAIIGDGAMTGGVAYEALNNAGRSKDNLLIVLNDNKMSIGKNVGGFSRHLTVIRSRPSYYRFKKTTEYHLLRLPGIGKWLWRRVRTLKQMVKNAVYHSNMFEELGIHYYGPVDGHDLEKLITLMEIAKNENRPVLIHAITKKGKGLPYAESRPSAYHGVPAFDPDTGELAAGEANFSAVFGKTLCELAAKDDRICAVTAAMGSGTGLADFAAQFPNRFFDVGIAEQHAVAFSAGLCKAGMRPVFAVYSSFLQRGYDQIIHDAAIGGLHIVLCVDRAGFVGEDGETHHGLLDAAFLSGIPNVTVYSPATFAELRRDLHTAIYADDGVAVVRYPRGGEAQIGQPAQKVQDGYSLAGACTADTALVTYGRQFAQCAAAMQTLLAAGQACCCIKLDCIAPISPAAIRQALSCKRVYFYEEGECTGGIGEQFGAMLLACGYTGAYRHIGVPHEFVPGAPIAELIEKYRLDAKSIHADVIKDEK